MAGGYNWLEMVINNPVSYVGDSENQIANEMRDIGHSSCKALYSYSQQSWLLF